MSYPNYLYPAYPYGQQPMYQSQMPQQAPQTPPDDRIFVANQAAANAFRVAPGATVRLWDSSEPVFYEKSAGMDGREYPMLIYEYALRQNKPTPVEPDLSQYITRDEFEKRMAERIKVKRKEAEENV